MILSIDELHKTDFQMSRINIFHQKPPYRTLTQVSRKVNGFLFIIHGNCTYSFEGGSFSLSPGSVTYLPYGSAHVLNIHSDDFEFYRIDFHLTVDGEIAQFSNVPLKLCHVAARECTEAVQSLADKYQFVHDTIGKTELMCTIFRALSANPANPRRDRLSPAVQYLLEHLTEKIDCSCLARACSLSSAQFYNLFHEEYQMSPLEYRNSLLMHRAVFLLQEGTFSVTEISEMLGFDNIAYFSRFFKKHQGVSPSKFQHAAE